MITQCSIPFATFQQMKHSHACIQQDLDNDQIGLTSKSNIHVMKVTGNDVANVSIFECIFLHCFCAIVCISTVRNYFVPLMMDFSTP